ncbi:MAG: molybdopterin-binding protein, partial [Oscillospiraceae bacterium]|nr:molybdopterin-binding protein [Oscillospiraceae bacterium]
MVCEILTIGTEILLGDILNSNSQYLSNKLAELGIDVYKHTSVGDNEERILSA